MPGWLVDELLGIPAMSDSHLPEGALRLQTYTTLRLALHKSGKGSELSFLHLGGTGFSHETICPTWHW